ncbi:hypothetical protein QFC19_005758 [Naganishia cerealis]|uniref:Uncharacterized protein n=1 Tax=Naganishia cerealis TaxID=610337 RepID=A0ACC2VLN0_9TREE|nr:hypothetical protein QFC19_005758 [Naganishia cerealis]
MATQSYYHQQYSLRKSLNSSNVNSQHWRLHHTVGQHLDDFKSNDNSTVLSPSSRSRGLLDQVAGFNPLAFHEQSSGPLMPHERPSWAPHPTKVKPKGKPSHREVQFQNDREPKQWDRKHIDGHLQFSTERFVNRSSDGRTPSRQESFDDSQKHRKILPRNVLQGWEASTPRMQPVPHLAIVPPTYEQFSAQHSHFKNFQGAEYEHRRNKEAGEYEFQDSDQLRIRFLSNGMRFLPLRPFHHDQRVEHSRSGVQYGPTTHSHPSTMYNSSAVEMLESLPYIGKDGVEDHAQCVQHGLYTWDGRPGEISDDNNEIIFLGERRNLTGVDAPEFDAPFAPYAMNRRPMPVDATNIEPSSVEKMDAMVNLLLVAAETLNRDEVAQQDRAGSESSADAGSHDYTMSSPSPMSLSPLQTLAKLSTERLIESQAAKSDLPGTANRSANVKPASIWIRGGQRSRNKEEVNKRKLKPYDRPILKAKRKSRTTSSDLKWCTDFPSFEKLAAARKGSISERTSLSDLPPGLGKKVNFADMPDNESFKTKSESETATSLEETSKPVLPVPKKRRGRPPKIKVEGAEQQPTPKPVQSKQPTRNASGQGGGEGKSTTTRSGRKVKSVRYVI